MHNPMISILIPERGRPAMLRRLIDSLFWHARGDQGFEVLVAIDDDDPAWPEPLDDLRVRVFVWPRPITLGVKLNQLAAEARGGIIQFLGNDQRMETPDWPTRMREGVARLPDGIGVPFLNSTLSPGEPTYPVITRQMMNIVGYFMEPTYSFWFIDTHWGECGRLLNQLFVIDVTVSPQEGSGLTHGMIDLSFWVHYFEAMRPRRVRDAMKLACAAYRGDSVQAMDVMSNLSARIEVCKQRTAHLSTEWFLVRWGGNAESPPSPRYHEAKANAERILVTRCD
jgi:glycosyltransferase involved in cell wall biosynthesis